MTDGNRIVQYLAAFSVTLSVIFQGIILAWPSPVLPKFDANETDFSLHKDQSSWAVALVTVGGIPGCLAAQYMADIIGRKKTILLSAVPGVIGSSMILFAKIPELLYVARFFCGLGGAMSIVVVSIYLAEIADKDIRGAFGTLIQFMANIGNLLMYTVGPFVTYTHLNLLMCSVPFIFFLSCLWIPESPYYHLKEGNMAGAEKELLRLKGLENAKPLEQELESMKAQVKRDMEHKTSIWELLRKKEYRKAVVVVTGLKVLQQMTGSIVIQSYLETILAGTSMRLTGKQCSIIYGIVQFFAGIVATILVDRAGRKPLLLLSSLGAGISLTLVGVYFFMQDFLHYDKAIMASVSLLPITGIVSFNILFAIGIGNIPYVMQAELFPTNVKSAASSSATMFGAFLAFIVSKTYQGLVVAAGLYTVFWIFAVISFGGVFFIYYVVPETKGKSLNDIQVKLERLRLGTKRNNNNDESPESVPLQTA